MKKLLASIMIDEKCYIDTYIKMLSLKDLIFLFVFSYYTHNFEVQNKVKKSVHKQLKKQNINRPKVSGPPSIFKKE